MDVRPLSWSHHHVHHRCEHVHEPHPPEILCGSEWSSPQPRLHASGQELINVNQASTMAWVSMSVETMSSALRPGIVLVHSGAGFVLIVNPVVESERRLR